MPAYNRVDGLTGFFTGEVRLSHLSAEALRKHDLSAGALRKHDLSAEALRRHDLSAGTFFLDSEELI